MSLEKFHLSIEIPLLSASLFLDHRQEMEGTESAEKEMLLQQIASLQEDLASLNLESKTMESMMESQIEVSSKEINELHNLIAFKETENKRIASSLIETKRELKLTKDHLIHSSLNSITKSATPPISPRKRSRQPLGTLDSNSIPTYNDSNSPEKKLVLLPSPMNKRVSLEIKNDSLESQMRLVTNKLTISKDMYESSIEKIAHLETDLQSMRELNVKLESQINDLMKSADMSVLNWDQERQVLIQNQHDLQERLQSWTTIIEKSVEENSALKTKCTKLEKIARLVKLKERGGALSAFKTPALA